MRAFAASVDKNYFPDPNDTVMDSLFKQYERVIIESIITSFGLDIFIKDQYGGDVDTIYNVRQIDTDSNMTYKNVANQNAYENLEAYDSASYHKDKKYTETVRSAKIDFNEKGLWQKDTYVEDNTVAPIRNKNIPLNRQGQLDHVIPAEEIHRDRGRILTGLNGLALANDPENLRYTNASLNRNMSSMSIDEYISWCEKNPALVNYNGKKGEPLPEAVKERLCSEYNRYKKEYDKRLALSYYSSSRFWQDTVKSAGNTAVKMGIRQVWGLIFTEVWFSVKSELEKAESPLNLEKLLNSIGEGIKSGFENAKKKYKNLIHSFFDGASAGALASLTTTLCNVFFTTAKNTVRVIRQSYISIVQATEILLLNPANYSFGERMRATSKILATGASIVVGTTVSEAVSESVGTLPVVGEIIPAFCGSLVTGIMTCSLLYFIDRNATINKLISSLNKIPSISNEVNYFIKQAEFFEAYAAELMKIDLDKFQKEIKFYDNLTAKINDNIPESKLNAELKNILIAIGEKPILDFSDFMNDKKNNRLVFKANVSM